MYVDQCWLSTEYSLDLALAAFCPSTVSHLCLLLHVSTCLATECNFNYPIRKSLKYKKHIAFIDFYLHFISEKEIHET